MRLRILAAARRAARAIALPKQPTSHEKTALQEDATRLIRRAAALNLTPEEIRDLINSIIEKIMPQQPQPGGKK